MLDESISYSAAHDAKQYDIAFNRAGKDGEDIIEHILTDEPEYWIKRMREDDTVTAFVLMNRYHEELMHRNKIKGLPRLYVASDIHLAQIIGIEYLRDATYKQIARGVASWAEQIESHHV